MAYTRFGCLRPFICALLACALLVAARLAPAADESIIIPTEKPDDYVVDGNLEVADGGSLHAKGALQVFGNITNSGLQVGTIVDKNLSASGDVINASGRNFLVNGTGTSSIDGLLDNSGLFTFGPTTSGSSGTTLRLGSLSNELNAQLLFNSGANLSVTGSIINSGTVTFQKSDVVIEYGTTFDNFSWTLAQGAFINRGTTTNANSGWMLLSSGNFQNQQTGVVTNQGVITLNNGQYVNQGMTDNQWGGSINLASGNFQNAAGGVLTNSGSIQLVSGNFQNASGGIVANQGVISLLAGNFDNVGFSTLSGDGLLEVSGTATFHTGSHLEGSPTITATAITLQGIVSPGGDGTPGSITFGAPTRIEGEVRFDLITPGDPGVGNDVMRLPGTFVASVTSSAPFSFYLADPAEKVGNKYEIIEGNVTVESRPTVYDNSPDRRIVLRTDRDKTRFTKDGLAYYALVARDVSSYENLAKDNHGNAGEIAFGRYLDKYFPEDYHSIGTNNADLQWFRDTLDLMPTEASEVRALGQMAGEIYAPVASVALQRQFFAFNQMAQHLREDQCRPCAPRLATLDKGPPAVVGYTPPIESWGPRGWVTGYGFGGSIASDSNVNGAAFGGGGVQTAFGYQITPQFGMGFFYDFGASELKNDFDEKAELAAHTFGGYMTWHGDCNYFTFVGGGGFSDTTAHRFIDLQNADNEIIKTACGNTNGGQAAFYGEFGRNICNICGETVNLRPYLGLLYMNVAQNAFTETGAGALDLRFDESTVNSFRTSLGGEVELRSAWTGNAIWTWRSVWVHECIGDASQGKLTASMAAISGNTYALSRPDSGSDWFVGGLGVRGTFLDGHLHPFANCDLILGNRESLYAGTGGVEFAW